MYVFYGATLCGCCEDPVDACGKWGAVDEELRLRHYAPRPQADGLALHTTHDLIESGIVPTFPIESRHNPTFDGRGVEGGEWGIVGI